MTFREALPQLSDDFFLTDSGIETDLIFNAGWELPEFASFPLVDRPDGRAVLTSFYQRHLAVADAFDCGVVLEVTSWRASPFWGERLGYSLDRLRAANVAGVALLAGLRGARAARDKPMVISGCIGPASDAYRPDQFMNATEAQRYHSWQIEVLADTEIDLVHAMTITYPAEAVGIVRAAAEANLPVAISFTTETDGRLPDGTTLDDAITQVELATGGATAYYGINCAYPTHFAGSLPAGEVGSRLRSLRPNASSKSHAELDESDVLDAGDLDELASMCAELRDRRPSFTILGGCCGTDARHVEAIAAACLAG